MNIKRMIGFGALVYVSSFILYLLRSALPFFPEDPMSIQGFVFIWVLNIPIVLFFAKWLFKTMQPSLKRGVVSGLVAIAVALVLDGVFILLALAAGQSLDEFQALYSNWKFYVTVLEVIALSAYAGFEFDGTYTEPDSK